YIQGIYEFLNYFGKMNLNLYLIIYILLYIEFIIK
ncbi:MAG: hypothetical protein RLY46_1296, partial [Bacteroidota bacterium]